MAGLVNSMPKSLLAVYSCHEYNYKHDFMRDWLSRRIVERVGALRDTWLRDVTIDYKIFYGIPPVGKEREPLGDEVFLNAPDGYFTSSWKTKALARWALVNGYDRLLKVDDDTFVHWDRMQESRGFSRGDYVGGSFIPDDTFASGGCYWLGKKAIEVVASSRISQAEWAEDRWVGASLQRANMAFEFEKKYYFQRAPDTTKLHYVDEAVLSRPHSYISFHSLHPSRMRSYYAEKYPGGG